MSFHYSSQDRFLSSKSPLVVIKRWITLAFPLIFFFVAVWLVFSKWETPPLTQIENELRLKNWKQAHELIDEYVKDESLSRLRLLMYGSILQSAVDLNLYQPNEIDDYYRKLRFEDSSRVFIEKELLFKMELFGDTVDFLTYYCDYADSFPSRLDSLFKQVEFINAIDTSTTWLIKDPKCITDLLERQNLPFIGKVNASALQLREDANRQSSSMATLPLGRKVLLRKAAQAETIDGVTSHWQFVTSAKGESGWAFSAYISKQKLR